MHDVVRDGCRRAVGQQRLRRAAVRIHMYMVEIAHALHRAFSDLRRVDMAMAIDYGH